MHIAILGAQGMIGRKLGAHLLFSGKLGVEAIERLTLADVVPPAGPVICADTPTRVVVEHLTMDLSSPEAAQTLVASRPDVIFHLAAIVSGEAERDFDKGYRINLDGSRHLFEAIRHAGTQGAWRPRLVFASSIAVFGQPFPESIPDEFHLTPLTSYGTQKAMTELLLCDYSRRGIFDGIGVRLPTICIRPGPPNTAVSGFFSSILREPLAGLEAVLPVSESVRHWHASPRSAVGFFMHAATLDLERVGPRRCLNMPGLSATVGEQIEALRRVAGPHVAERIRYEPDVQIQRFVDGWAQRFDAQRAVALGFVADACFEDIIKQHIDDELSGQIR